MFYWSEKMFVEERKEQILEMVRKFGKVKVKELSERFDVTEDCIRKDLASLEKRNFLALTSIACGLERILTAPP